MATPPPPSILGTSLTFAKAQFSFTFQSLVGSVIEIQTSADLATWSTTATVTNPTATATFNDPVTSSQHRFYRLRQR